MESFISSFQFSLQFSFTESVNRSGCPVRRELRGGNRLGWVIQSKAQWILNFGQFKTHLIRTRIKSCTFALISPLAHFACLHSNMGRPSGYGPIEKLFFFHKRLVHALPTPKAGHKSWKKKKKVFFYNRGELRGKGPPKSLRRVPHTYTGHP